MRSLKSSRVRASRSHFKLLIGLSGPVYLAVPGIFDRIIPRSKHRAIVGKPPDIVASDWTHW